MTRTGSARWLGNVDQEALKDGEALLRIETRTGAKVYWVFYNGQQAALKRLDNGEVYRIVGNKCDCPDATHRNVVCKHAKALAAALPRVQ